MTCEKNINSLSVLSAIYQRLLSIERYSTTPKTVKESVAAHAYCVTLLCMLFAAKHPELDELRMLKMGIVHDCEEAFSGDIMSNVKRFHPEVRNALETAAEEFLDIMLENLETRDAFKNLWLEYKDRKTEEARFVKIADIVSRVFLMRIEYELGNRIIVPILSNSCIDLKELNAPKWIVDEVDQMLSDVEMYGAKEFTKW